MLFGVPCLLSTNKEHTYFVFGGVLIPAKAALLHLSAAAILFHYQGHPGLHALPDVWRRH